MTHPDFSIVIPTLNRPLQLTQCLKSLAAQNYAPDRFEVIVVDDGGESTAADTVSQFRKELRITGLRQERGGPSAARNAGVRISRGRYLAFTDDDCMPDPNWLPSLERGLVENHNCLAGGRVVNALSGNPYAEASQIIIDFAYAYYRSRDGSSRFFASNNMSMPADIFRRLGGFAEQFRTSEDRDFCDRWLGSGYRLTFVPDAVVRHAHTLDLGRFWKQHMGYGRGAWRFYRAYRSRHTGKSSIELGFYRTLLLRLPRMIMAKSQNRAMLIFLMGVWQLANSAGFLAEAMESAGNQSAKESDNLESS